MARRISSGVSMLSKLQRFGKKKEGVRVSVQIISIVFEKRETIPFDSFLSVAYERNGIVKCTTYKPLSADGAVVAFDELFDFTATLYNDSSGSAQKKTRNLCVRRRSGTTSTEFGNVTLELDGIQRGIPCRLSLRILRNGEYLNATLESFVTITSVGDDVIPDDASSIVSDVTPSSTQAKAAALVAPEDSTQGSLPSHQPSTSDSAKLIMDLEQAVVDKENAKMMLSDALRDNTILQEKLILTEASNKQSAADIASLSREVEDTRSQMEVLRSSFREKEDAMRTLQLGLEEQISARESSLKSKTAEVVAMKSEILQLQNSQKSREMEIERIKSEILLSRRDSDATISSLNRQLESLKQQLVQANVSSSSSMQSLLSERDALKFAKASLNSSAQSLLSERDALKAELSSTRASSSSSLQALSSEMDALKAELVSARASGSSSMQAVQSEKDALKAELLSTQASSRLSAQALLSERDALKAELLSAQASNTSLTQTLLSERDALKAELVSAKASITSSAQALLSERDGWKAALLSAQASSSSSMQTLLSERDALKAELLSTQANSASLIQTLLAERDALKAALSLAQDSSTSSAQASFSERDALKTQLVSAQANYGTPSQQALLLERDALKAELASSSTAMQALASERDALRLELKSFRSSRTEIESEMTWVLGWMEELAAERNNLEENLKGIAAECDRARAERDSILKAYEATLNGIAAQHITFKAVSDEEFSQLRQEIVKLSYMVADLEAKNSSLEQQLSKCTTATTTSELQAPDLNPERSGSLGLTVRWPTRLRGRSGGGRTFESVKSGGSFSCELPREGSLSSHVATMLLKKGDLDSELAAAMEHAQSISTGTATGGDTKVGGPTAGGADVTRFEGAPTAADSTVGGEAVSTSSSRSSGVNLFALRRLADEERAKTQVLRACVLRFANQLSEAEIAKLQAAGIELP